MDTNFTQIIKKLTKKQQKTTAKKKHGKNNKKTKTWKKQQKQERDRCSLYSITSYPEEKCYSKEHFKDDLLVIAGQHKEQDSLTLYTAHSIGQKVK